MKLPAHMEAKGIYSPCWHSGLQRKAAITNSSIVTRSRLASTAWWPWLQICTQAITQGTHVHCAAIANDGKEFSRTDFSTEVKCGLPCTRLNVLRPLSGMCSFENLHVLPRHMSVISRHCISVPKRHREDSVHPTFSFTRAGHD